MPGNYDPATFYENAVIGSLIWGDFQFGASLAPGFDNEDVLSRSYYTKFLTQICTKIVNVPVLNYSESYGIDGCSAASRWAVSIITGGSWARRAMATRRSTRSSTRALSGARW